MERNLSVLSPTYTAAKLQDVKFWVHISQLTRALLDIWSCVNAGDLKIKLTRKTSNTEVDCFLPKHQIKNISFLLLPSLNILFLILILLRSL